MTGSSETQATPTLVPRRTPFGPQQIAIEFSSGALACLLSLGVDLSLAALIFAGPLSAFIPNGIGLILIGTAIMNLVLAWRSAQPPMITHVQDAPTVVVALMVAQLAASLPAGDPATTYATVVAAIALTTVVSGAVFWLLGQFRLGSLVRFLPFPVVGGFLAGTGWLLTIGGVSILANSSTELAALPALFVPATLIGWLPGFLFGALLLLLTRRTQHPMVVPGALIAATALFYLWLALSGTPFSEAQARGLLLGPLPTESAWAPLTPAMLAEVEWAALGSQLGAIATAVTIGVIGLLLNVSGLQLARRVELDLNRELKANGLAQLLGGAIGSPPGFTGLGASIFCYRMGARTAIPSLVVALLFVLLFLFGLELLGLVPRVVLGGVVCYLGLAFLAEWLYDAWFQLPRIDYLLVLLILTLVIVFGMLAGVVAGLAIAVGLFVVAYSRINVVKHTLSAVTLKSRMTRSYQEQLLLREQGEQIAIFQLQGFLFFGTASELQERVSQRLLMTNIPPLRFALFDFRLVPRIDATALQSFAQLLQLAESRGITLIFTQLAPAIEAMLARSLFQGTQHQRVRFFPTLDHGLEWCENTLLSELPAAPAAPLDPQTQAVLALFERRQFAPGDYLIRQGDEPNDLFVIEEGQVTARIEPDHGPPTRLESMGRGRVVGELGFLLGTPRTAAVIADEATTARRISREALERLKIEQPERVATLNELLARLLSERVVHLIGTVEALQR